MLLAIRKVVQESTGFSPNELVFGHTVRGPIALLAEEWRTSDPPENVLDYVSSFHYRLYEARAIALRKLSKTQKKRQRLFDRKFSGRRSQVLALLPFLSSPFQAKFTGPYMIAKCYPNNNYLLNTPNHRKKVQVCHVNLLKPFMTPVSSLTVNVVTADIIESSVSKWMADVLEEKNGPSHSIVEGRLNNSEVLANLAYHLSHLHAPEKTDIIKLVSLFPSLFSDVPTRTHVIEYDIDVGMAQPVKQHTSSKSYKKEVASKRGGLFTCL